MDPRIIISAIAALFCLVMGLIGILQNPKNRLNIAFFLFNFSIFFWNSSDFFGPFFQSSPPLMLAYYRLSYLGGIFLVPCFFYLITFLSNSAHSKTEKIISNFLNLIAVGLILCLPTPYLIQSVTYYGTFQETPGKLYGAFILYFLLGLLYNIFRLYQNQKKTTHENDKQKQRIFLLAATFALTCGAFSFLVISTGGPRYGWVIFYLFEVIYVGITSYAVLKKGLIDIHTALGKGGAYFLLSGLVAVTFIIPYALLKNYPVIYISSVTSIGIFWGIFGFKFHQFLITTVKRTFIQGYYDGEYTLSRITARLAKVVDHRSLFLALQDELDSALELEQVGCIIAMRNSERQLTSYLIEVNQMQLGTSLSPGDPFISFFNFEPEYKTMISLPLACKEKVTGLGFPNKALLFPFHSPEALEGILILGARSNGATFTQKDLNFFAFISSIVAATLYRLTPAEVIQEEYKNHLKLAGMQQIIRTLKCEIASPLSVISDSAGWIAKPGQSNEEILMLAETIAAAVRRVEKVIFRFEEASGLTSKNVENDPVKPK